MRSWGRKIDDRKSTRLRNRIMVTKIESYKDLDVWKMGIEQCVQIYKATTSFPKDELYGLVSQIRRASVSVPANIAEGYSRRYDKEKVHFISNALASNAEIETHLLIAKKLGFIDEGLFGNLEEINNHLGRSLTNFYRSLKDNFG